MGAEKVWTGDLQTPCGSAGEARLLLQRQAGAPSPLVPSRTFVRAAAPPDALPIEETLAMIRDEARRRRGRRAQ
jgi:hypothetical protein